MDDMLKLGLTLMVVTLVASLALALTNHYTTDRIELQKENAVKESLNRVISADSFEDKGEYYDAQKGGELVGRVLKVEAPGYSSVISALAGIDTKNKITGVDIISQQETPGLGAKIEEESFLKQFIGKGKEDILLKKDGGQIDGITGATVSSRALTNEVRRLMEECACDSVTSASPETYAKEEETDSITKASPKAEINEYVNNEEPDEKR